MTIVVQAAIYLRISQDRTGLRAGVQRQEADCLALAARLGVEDAPVFVDNDISAFDGRDRPGYQALINAVRRGVTHIVVWHVDRLYRRPRELEDLLDLVEQYPVRIEAVRGGGFDLNTTEGRLMARQLVAIAAYESGHKSDRVKRANRRLAQQGRWHGPARYGYGPGGVLIPEQAAVIRQMADRFLAGESLRSIAMWLNHSKIPPLGTKNGTSGLWYPYTVRSVLASARISGQRAYSPDTHTDPAGGREILGPGEWDPIITPGETARIREILADPGRRRTQPARPSLLGGIARCGKCGAGLTIAGHSRTTGRTLRLRYTCQRDPSRPQRGGLSIDATHLEDYVTGRVLHRLAHPRASSDTASPSALLAQVTMINERIHQLDQDRRARLIATSEYRAGLGAAEEALAETSRQLVATGGAIALHAAPIGDPVALQSWWQALDTTDRRAVITTLISTLRISPGKPGRSFDPSRIRITYRR
ncbi:recombinase family protein [Nesterenkonia muleiensis]|uniref:recombinase family protein n=1 Tax=Nesterenkonia muleiensis TaxID=2282648 RepID=UPI00138FEEC5|nr:recombinase family protein [Nesterenkonia muleiensis]